MITLKYSLLAVWLFTVAYIIFTRAKYKKQYMAHLTPLVLVVFALGCLVLFVFFCSYSINNLP